MQFGLPHVAERAAAQLASEFDCGARALEVLDVGRGLVIGRADAHQARAEACILVLCVHVCRRKSTTEDIDKQSRVVISASDTRKAVLRPRYTNTYRIYSTGSIIN